jgi:hypothetical protein
MLFGRTKAPLNWPLKCPLKCMRMGSSDPCPWVALWASSKSMLLDGCVSPSLVRCRAVDWGCCPKGLVCCGSIVMDKERSRIA